MTAEISPPSQCEYLEAFSDARCGLQGVYGSYAYHHQIHPANETWMVNS